MSHYRMHAEIFFIFYIVLIFELSIGPVDQIQGHFSTSFQQETLTCNQRIYQWGAWTFSQKGFRRKAARRVSSSCSIEEFHHRWWYLLSSDSAMDPLHRFPQSHSFSSPTRVGRARFQLAFSHRWINLMSVCMPASAAFISPDGMWAAWCFSDTKDSRRLFWRTQCKHTEYKHICLPDLWHEEVLE